MESTYDFEDLSVVETEIESLQAIFIDELTLTRKPNGNIDEIQVQLHPFTGHDTTKQYVCMTLIIKPSLQYPDEIPFFEIRNPRGLGEEEVISIYQEMKLKAEEYLGEPMLYTLIELARESLTEDNVPRCQCVLCLDFFDEDQAFHRTSCYHYFHTHCLSAYVSHTKQVMEEERVRREEEGRAHMVDKAELTEIVCPVCRKPLDDDSLAVYTEVRPDCDEFIFELSPEMRKQQKWMAEVYARQKARGGIIDLEAEKNKFLISEDTVLATSLPVKNEKSEVKESHNFPQLEVPSVQEESDQSKRRGPKGRGRGRGHTTERYPGYENKDYGRGKGGRRFENRATKENSYLEKGHHQRTKEANENRQQNVDQTHEKNEYTQRNLTPQKKESKSKKLPESESRIKDTEKKESINGAEFDNKRSYDKRESKNHSRSNRQVENRSQTHKTHDEERGHRQTHKKYPRETDGDFAGNSDLDDDQKLARDLHNHQINQKWREKNYGKDKPYNNKPIKFGVQDDDVKDNSIKFDHKKSFQGSSLRYQYTDTEAIDDYRLAFDDSEYDCWEAETDEFAFESRHVRMKDWHEYKKSRKDYEQQLDKNLKDRLERERSLYEEERRMRNEAEKRRIEEDKKAKTQNSSAVKSILDQFKERKQQKVEGGESIVFSKQSDTGDKASVKTDVQITNEKVTEAGAVAGDVQWVSESNTAGSDKFSNKRQDHQLDEGYSERTHQRNYSHGDRRRGGKQHRHYEDNQRYSDRQHEEKDRGQHRLEDDDRRHQRRYDDNDGRYQRHYEENDKRHHRRHENTDRRTHRQEDDDRHYQRPYEDTEKRHHKKHEDDRGQQRKSGNQSRRTRPNDSRECFYERCTEGDNRKEGAHNNFEDRSEDWDRDSHGQKQFQPDHRKQRDLSDNVSGFHQGGDARKALDRNKTSDNHNQNQSVLRNKTKSLLTSQSSEASESIDCQSSVKSETESCTSRPDSQVKDAKFKKAKPLDFTKKRGQQSAKKKPNAPPPGL